MLEQVDYLIKDEAAVIYRCYGQGSFIDLPSHLEGYPVKALGDHCFAPESSSLLSSNMPQMNRAVLSDQHDAEKMGIPLPLCGRQIEEVVLPETVEEIGDYAFYHCEQLSQLHLPAALKRLGRGPFVAANHLRTVHWVLPEDQKTPPCLKNVLEEITDEIEIVLKKQGDGECMRLLFPGYYEDSVENTPARIIVVAYEGTGYKYRQCFKGRELDLERYDALFYTASVQELPSTVLTLAFDRLSAPVDLSQKARESYLDYLRREAALAARWVIAHEAQERDLMHMLTGNDYFGAGEEGRKLLQVWLDEASARQQTEMVTILMDIKRVIYPGKRQHYFL